MTETRKTIEDAWNEVKEMEFDRKFREVLEKNKDLNDVWNHFVTNFYDTETLFTDLFGNPDEPGRFIRDIQEQNTEQVIIVTSPDDITCVTEP